MHQVDFVLIECRIMLRRAYLDYQVRFSPARLSIFAGFGSRIQVGLVRKVGACADTGFDYHVKTECDWFSVTSGVVATRFSPTWISFSTPIFITCPTRLAC